MSKTWTLPQVDETRCTLCGLCVEACLCHAVKLGERGPVFTCQEACRRSCVVRLGSPQVVRLGSPQADTCNCWCLCEEVCPTGAITCAFEIVSADVT